MGDGAGRFVSYAGNHEDVLLLRAFRGWPPGFYIDVGAHDPDHGSVTKALYDRGWSGVNVEPAAAAAAAFAAGRPRDVNLTAAVGSRPGRAAFHEVPDKPMLSTLDDAAARRCRAKGLDVVSHPIEVTTLAAVCERHVGGKEIDVLIIDTEGGERDVLLGADFGRWRPKVLCIEATVPETNVPAHEGWEPIVLGADYAFALFDGVNRWYVRAESPDLVPVLSCPVNQLDHFVTPRQLELERRAALYWGYGRAGRAAAAAVSGVVRAARRLTGRRR